MEIPGTLKLILLCCMLPHSAAAQTITTIAGTDSAGYNGDNIQATTARLNNPTFLAINYAGELLFADTDNNRIRKIGLTGIVTTVAGTGVSGYNGDNIPATDAQISAPVGIAVDGCGSIFIADNYSHRIRKIDATGTITTIAGTGAAGFSGDNGPATLANLNYPHGIAVDNYGNIFIADDGNDRIRKIDAAGKITTIAGGGTGLGDGGPATNSILIAPYGVALDDSGNVYVTEITGSRIRKIDAAGEINTIAGTGSPGFNGDDIIATTAKLKAPTGIVTDNDGTIYFCDVFNQRVRKITPAGIISTIAGTGTAGKSDDGIPATVPT